MIYEPNTRHWERGDVVIHDCDRKAASMLMRVIGYNVDGLAVCVYVKDDRAKGRSKRYPNDIKYLHDPKRFRIEIPA